MFAKLCSKLASRVSKTQVACDGSLMWKKIHVEIEYLKLKFPILHISRTDLFFFFLSSFLLPSRSNSYASYPI